jgi:hypothetical protein
LVAAQDAPGGELRIMGRGRARSGINVDQAATEALDQALAGNTRSDLNYIAATLRLQRSPRQRAAPSFFFPERARYSISEARPRGPSR